MDRPIMFIIMLGIADIQIAKWVYLVYQDLSVVHNA